LLFQNLLENQFDYNNKFKEKVNEKPPDVMRFQPIGRDKNGLAYWYLLVSISTAVNETLTLNLMKYMTMHNICMFVLKSCF